MMLRQVGTTMKEGKTIRYFTAILWLGALTGTTWGQFPGGETGGLGDQDGGLDVYREIFTNEREDIPDDEVTGEVAKRKGVATCVSSGDPHFQLFNGLFVHYQGNCTYTMLRDNCDSIPLGPSYKFLVTAEFYRKDPNVAATWTKETSIHLPEKNMTIRLSKDLKIYVNGDLLTNISYTTADGDVYIGKIVNKIFVVATIYGLQVNWDGLQLTIVVSNTYAGSLCGICGDIGQLGLIIGPNDECLDDGLTPGSSTTDHVVYGNSWQVPSTSCGCQDLPPPCPDDTEAQAVCAELTNPSGRFASCLSNMLLFDPEAVQGFKDACVFDVCVAGALAMCDTAEDLVDHCRDVLGIIIDNWRSDIFCPPECPPNMHWSTCADPCEPDTCPPNTFGTCISADACIAACTCDDGFLLNTDNNECVTECPPPVPTDCPTGQDLHCFTCRARTEIGCWLCGHYEKCDSGDICFHETYNKNNNTHHRVRRGCIPEDECYPGGIGNGNYSCLTVEDRCRNCDNHFGHPTPSQPKRPRSRCKPADYGICYCKGDPHCESYDGYYFENMNVGCWHVLTRDNCTNDDAQFAVHIKIEKLTGPKKINKWAVSAVKIVHLNQILIVTRQKGFYTFNGAAGQFVSGSNPISSAPNIAVDFNPSYWTMRVYVNGFQVSWDFSRAVSVWAPDNKNGTLCGICGDFNGDKDTGDNVYGPSTGDGQCAAVTDLNVNPGDTATSDERLGLSWYSKHSGDVDCDDTCAI